MTRSGMFALVAVFGGMGIVGTIDRQVAESSAAERQASQRGSVEPARIWSKKCYARGKQIIAKQPDGGKWIIHCVNANAGLRT